MLTALAHVALAHWQARSLSAADTTAVQQLSMLPIRALPGSVEQCVCILETIHTRGPDRLLE